MKEEEPTDIRTTITARIHELRKQKSITQRDLAERSGVSRRTIQAIEAGKINPRIDILNAIAEALGQSIDIREKD